MEKAELDPTGFEHLVKRCDDHFTQTSRADPDGAAFVGSEHSQDDLCRGARAVVGLRQPALAVLEHRVVERTYRRRLIGRNPPSPMEHEPIAEIELVEFYDLYSSKNNVEDDATEEGGGDIHKLRKNSVRILLRDECRQGRFVELNFGRGCFQQRGNAAEMIDLAIERVAIGFA